MGKCKFVAEKKLTGELAAQLLLRLFLCITLVPHIIFVIADISVCSRENRLRLNLTEGGP